MAAPFLKLVAEFGHRLPSEPVWTETRAHPDAAAFLRTLELALHQGQRILERPEQHAPEMVRLARAVVDQTAPLAVAEAGEGDWTIEPFVGA